MSRTRLIAGIAVLLAWGTVSVVMQPKRSTGERLEASEPSNRRTVPVRPPGRVIPPPDGEAVPSDLSRHFVLPTVVNSAPVKTPTRNGLLGQSLAEESAKSQSCVGCHKTVGDPHGSQALNLGCTDCHGGDATSPVKDVAHVQPRHPAAWNSSANPIRSYTLLNHERPEFIRFVNPGDLRVAHQSCGTTGCHPRETLEVKKSMM
ncbi:MAG TPA: hypothetical protein DCE47_05205, partial [Planctomycetaceae bacterium]|nr:hypothetical protein [Planctomycetaceae bacterium]